MKFYSAIDRIYQYLLPMLVIGLGIQCAITTMHNRQLKKEIQSKWNRPTQTFPLSNLDSLKPGEKVNAISLLDLAGVEKTIIQPNSGKKTLLLAFTTTCPACKANSLNWVNLYPKMKPQEWEVYGLSLDDAEKTKTYIAEKGFQFPVLTLKDKKEIQNQLKIRKIPTTIAIDENQNIIQVWVGGLEGKIPEVEKALGISK